VENETIHQTEQNESRNEPKDERADWVTPVIVDYDIEEATRAAPGTFPVDSNNGYS
jgi:hypothetical protein